MSDETQNEKKENGREANNAQQKPDYAKWFGIVATFLSIFLTFLTYKLDVERRNAETQLQKIKNRQDELSANLEEIRGRIDIDFNSYFEGAATTPKKFMESNSLNSMFPNEVYNQIVSQMKRGRWDSLNNLMRCVYGIYNDKPNFGIINSRQILYFEIFYNPSSDSKKSPAEQLEITYRFKDFPSIPISGSLTRQYSFKELESDVNNWQTKTVEVGQLKAGKKITIPVAHMVGPYVYSESVVIPMKIHWYNPLLKKSEEKSLNLKSMLSELDAKSQGSLLGNIGKSCQ
ncbi:hypothetical protein QUB80_17900 [Chlorogloeopsis sp. ULAP01]|uniref:hypothetical protein n=1 Tax=Chlorogloeopsis sp. ULAP01 TaxID=3056483 RepID=UPI0025AB3A54|nr:hypothetical protein [Chlorogloeopsis sp. ULAP01]MDM9382576.1 hypothetical protein [Chlorogloeopsis sp. ULAP01]